METQHRHSGRFWRRLIGWTCLGIGLLGILLPIIPGTPFLVAGMVTLSAEHRWLRALLIWAERKLGKLWPRVFKMSRMPRRRSRILKRQAKASS